MKKKFFFLWTNDKLIISFSIIPWKVTLYIYILYFDSAGLIIKFVYDLIGKYKIFI